MVTSPEEVYNIYGKDKIILERIEDRIDAIMKKTKDPDGPVRIPFNADCYCVDMAKLEDYLRKYEQAGWTQVRIVEREDRHAMEFWYARKRRFGRFEKDISCWMK